MSVEIIQQRLATYACRSTLEEEQALREITQEIILAALEQQGPWKAQAPKTDNAWCVEKLRALIIEHDWNQARREMRRFVNPHELPSLDLWSRDYFLRQCDELATASAL